MKKVKTTLKFEKTSHIKNEKNWKYIYLNDDGNCGSIV